jgi:branched-chain amino acid transport system substrate-binding protein
LGIILPGVIAAATPVSAAEQVKIGFISTLSGPLSSLGTEIRDGFDLAAKASGHRVGGLPVEIVSGDDQASPDVGKQIADKLLKRDKVDVLTGIVYSNVLLAVAPSAFAAKTFYISAASGPASLAGRQCTPYFFAVGWQNDGQSEAMGQYLTDKSVKTTYTLAPNYAGGKENINGFRRTYRGEIVSESYVKLGELDYSSEIAQIRAIKPEALFFFLPGGMGVNFIKQYIAAGLDKEVPFYAPGYSADEDTIGAVGEPVIGLKSTSHYAWDLDNPANRTFVAAFRDAYHRTPTMYAAQGYDVYNLIDSAVAAVNGKIENKSAFHEALKAARFNSVRGYFAFNSNQYPVQDFYLRVAVRDDAGALTSKTLSKVFDKHADAYAKDCELR